MATATYEPIATTTLTTAAATITFSSIPGTYTDLRLVLVYKVSTVSSTPALQINSDTLGRYTKINTNGNGVAVSAASSIGQTSISLANQVDTTIPQIITVDIFNYASTTVKKPWLITTSEDRNTAGSVNFAAATYNQTTDYTTLNLSILYGGNYSIDTTATLYGILKA